MGYCFLYKRGSGSGGSNRPVVVKTAMGSIISLTDSTNGKLKGLRIYGKTTQNGTPSPEAPAPLESVGDDGNVTVFVGKSQTDANPQSATFETPNGLPGLRVDSGGNYTDENGQMRLCDEIDGARGVRAQRVLTKVFSDASGWILSSAGSGKKRFGYQALQGIIRGSSTQGSKANLLCSNFPITSAEGTWNGIDGICADTSGIIYIYYGDVEQTLQGLGNYLASNPVTLMAELATPIETPLSAEELAQYAALHTNYPNTTIFGDGADMEVKYTSGG